MYKCKKDMLIRFLSFNRRSYFIKKDLGSQKVLEDLQVLEFSDPLEHKGSLGSRGSEKVLEDSRGSEKVLEGSKGSEKVQEDSRGSEKVLKDSRGSHKVLEDSRGSEKVLEGSRGSQKVLECPR